MTKNQLNRRQVRITPDRKSTALMLAMISSAKRDTARPASSTGTSGHTCLQGAHNVDGPEGVRIPVEIDHDQANVLLFAHGRALRQPGSMGKSRCEALMASWKMLLTATSECDSVAKGPPVFRLRS